MENPYESTRYEPCVRISAAMKKALEGAGDSDPGQVMPPDPKEQDRKRRWSTGIVGLDRHTRGGFHGFCGLAGDTGVGKSDIAFRAACLAALDGWTVYYINGELDRDDMQTRFARIVRGDGLSAGEIEKVRENLVVHHIDRTTTLASVVAFMEDDVLTREAVRVIVVWDTVDTIASWHGRFEYFEVLEGIYLWSMGVRKIVPDLVSVLCIAESNRDGIAKGRRMEKWADFALSAKAGRKPGTVMFKVTKGRYSGWTDRLTYDHLWDRCQFRLSEIQGE